MVWLSQKRVGDVCVCGACAGRGGRDPQNSKFRKLVSEMDRLLSSRHAWGMGDGRRIE